MIEITRPLMTLTDDEGVPVEGVTKSASEVEAMEKASQLPDGDYYLDRPTALITVKRDTVAPPVDPPIDPPIEPLLPFGDIPALQALGLLPEYAPTGRTVSPDTNIDWSGAGGERGEIGLYPEQHAAYVAGQADLLPSILEAALAFPPSNVDHAHKPNLFWLPYLMAGEAQYVRNMEEVHRQHQNYHDTPQDAGFDFQDCSRELAWSLRDLGHLAYLEGLGVTEKTHYINALNKTLAFYLARITTTKQTYQTWNVLEFDRISGWERYGWCGWMESMVGQVLNNLVIMGFTDWQPIAEWHFQHLLKRSGDEWPFKAVDNDHVYFSTYPVCADAADWGSMIALSQNADWQNVTAYRPGLMAEFDGHPDGALVPVNAGLTYSNRAQYAYGWAALAARNGIAVAQEKRDELYTAIKNRGDGWNHKNHVAGGVLVDPVIPEPTPEPEPIEGVPAWRQSVAPGTWAIVPQKTTMAEADPANDPEANPNYPKEPPWGIGLPKNHLDFWTGGCFNAETGEWHAVRVGGHGADTGNTWFKINLRAESPEWEIVEYPTGSPLATEGIEKIGEMHTYNKAVYVPDYGPIMAQYGGGAGARALRFHEDTGATEKLAVMVSPTGQGSATGSCHDPSRKLIWHITEEASYMFKYDYVNDIQTRIEALTRTNSPVSLCYIPAHDLIALSTGTHTYNNYGFQLFDCNTEKWRAIKFTGTPDKLCDGDVQMQLVGTRIYYWNQDAGSTSKLPFIQLPDDPLTQPWIYGTEVPATESNVVPSVRSNNGTFGKFSYDPVMGGFFLINRADGEYYFYALAAR